MTGDWHAERAARVQISGGVHARERHGAKRTGESTRWAQRVSSTETQKMSVTRADGEKTGGARRGDGWREHAQAGEPASTDSAGAVDRKRER